MSFFTFVGALTCGVGLVALFAGAVLLVLDYIKTRRRVESLHDAHVYHAWSGEYTHDQDSVS